MLIKDLLSKDPYREIPTVVQITDHDPRRVWVEMDEYVPTERVKPYFRETVEVLLDTRQGPTEKVCIWVSGFFGSGKSHFLKVLGFLLEDHDLIDNDGKTHSSQEFLCQKLELTNLLPLLQKEFKIKVLFINLLDHDYQSPQRPTISRLILREFYKSKGFSTDFETALWEQEIYREGKWDEFRRKVKEIFQKDWEQLRRLYSDNVLARVLPIIFPERFSSDEKAKLTLEKSKQRLDIPPSEVVNELVMDAERLDPVKGRIVLLLDEVGLYIGESIDRLTDLNALAEHVVKMGKGKILLVATAQEAITDLVPKLTRDRQILSWLQDRFRLQFGLLPTEVKEVISRRLLEKNAQGAKILENIYEQHQGKIRANLTLGSQWEKSDFVKMYPCHPYSIELVQQIQSRMRTTTQEARRLSASERSLLKLVHAILVGEGNLEAGAKQNVGWFISLDTFYDAISASLRDVRSEEIQAINNISKLGEVQGLPIVRIAKALYLLQFVHQLYPTTPENIASVLVDGITADIHKLREVVNEGLKKLQNSGWVSEENGQYRLLTPAEHNIERTINSNYPRPAERQRAVLEIFHEIFRNFKYEHGNTKRPFQVAIEVDGNKIFERGHLRVHLYSPLSDITSDDLIGKSVNDPHDIFWKAEEPPGFRRKLERIVAIEKTLQQLRTRSLSLKEREYVDHLDRELQGAINDELPRLVQKGFLSGYVYIAGSQLKPAEGDFRTALKTYLRQIADLVYHQFVDHRVKDDDCAAILSWRPGVSLPPVFYDLQLITQSGTINRDATQVKIVLSELKRRYNAGEPISGKALIDHFERPPYGWDPKLTRLLVSVLLKLGAIKIRSQNRDITDPLDPQLPIIFKQIRHFQQIEIIPLKEVDWRVASEKTSEVFGVQGGDTFEKTAEIIKKETEKKLQEVSQLCVRCVDNGLPSQIAEICKKARKQLEDLLLASDSNTCLRNFLEIADQLKSAMSTIRLLEKFPFSDFQQIRRFTEIADEWASSLNITSEAFKRWRQLKEDIIDDNVLSRVDKLRESFAFLKSTYYQDYKDRHEKLQEAVNAALEQLRAHKAFNIAREQAEQILDPLKQLQCEGDGTPDEKTFLCPSCNSSFGKILMGIDAIKTRLHQMMKELDALIPRPPQPEQTRPLYIREFIRSEEDINILADKIRRYLKQVRRKVKVELTVTPED